MHEMASKSQVDDIRKSCLDYETKLAQIIHSLNESIDIVNRNAENVTSKVNNYFDKVTDFISSLIKQKRKETLQNIAASRSETVESLTQCKKLVEEKLVTTENILEECRNVKNSDNNVAALGQDYKLAALNKMSSTVGSLPEVPAAHNLPVIRVQLNESFQDEVRRAMEQMSAVTASSPVQFSSWKHYPGAVFLQWHEVNDEEIDDPQFCLRYCKGDVSKQGHSTKHVVDFKGSETGHMIRNLEPKTCYSFQVAYSKECFPVPRFGNEEAWSYPLVLNSTLPHYKFQNGSNGYELNHNGREASKVETSQDLAASLLTSHPPPNVNKHSIMFVILEDSYVLQSDCEGIGLMHDAARNPIEKWGSEGSVTLNVNGAISVNGKTMTTKLPMISKGDVIIFNSELVKSGPTTKLRICIESKDKQVTFDWTQPASSHSSLHGKEASYEFSIDFGVLFFSRGWKIRVQ